MSNLFEMVCVKWKKFLNFFYALETNLRKNLIANPSFNLAIVKYILYYKFACKIPLQFTLTAQSSLILIFI